jgi:hypothetical protein
MSLTVAGRTSVLGSAMLSILLRQAPLSAQRTAVQLRPHQQTGRNEVGDNRARGSPSRATGGRCGSRRRAAVCCSGLLGGVANGALKESDAPS